MAVVFLTLWVFSVSVTAAGSASFKLTPDSGSLTLGSELQVVIEVVSDESVNAAQADINYDGSQLDYVGVSYSNSAFNLGLSESDNGSTVSVARGISENPVSGTNRFAVLIFKVLTSSGSGSLTMGLESAIMSSASNENIWNQSTNGANYTFSQQQVDDSGSNNSNISTAPISQQTVSEVADDEPVAVEDKITTEQTYLVAIRVLDNEGNPVSGVEVVLDDDQKETSDDAGVTSFVGVSPGEHKVSILGNSYSVTVKDGDATEVQDFDIQSVKSEVSSSLQLVLIILAVALSLFIIALLILRHKKNKSDKAQLNPISSVDSLNNSQSIHPARTTPSQLSQEQNSVQQPSEVVNPTEPAQSDNIDNQNGGV